MALALPPDGLLLTMELDAGRAATARQNFARAGVESKVNVIVGDASRFLHKVAGPFDLIFQDGSKQLYEPLLDRLVDRLRPGGDRKSTRLNSSHVQPSRMPSSA